MPVTRNGTVEQLGTKPDGSAPVEGEDREVFERHLDVVTDFADYCLSMTGDWLTEEEKEYVGDDPYEEVNFYDFSLGFFIARGVPIDDAFALARLTRYRYQYWEWLA